MQKDEKRKQAEALREELAKAKSVLLSGFEGITVAQDTDLRSKVAKAGAKYRVVKNSLIERGAQGTPVEPAVKKLRGTTSLAYTETDPVGLAKIITTYAKENPILVFKTGVVEGRVVSLADLSALASLPSRDALLSKVLFLIKSPAQRAASTLAGVARNPAFVIQQGVQQSRFQGTGDRGQRTDTDVVQHGGQETKFQDKKDQPTNSEGFRSLKHMINIKLAVGRGPSEREQAARALVASGGDPCDFGNVLPTLPRVYPAHPNPPGVVYDGLADSEKQEIQTYYQVECAKLRTEFPELFAQKAASN